MTEELKEIGLDVGHRRVGRLRRQNGRSVVRPRKHKVTTDSDHKFNIAPNLLDRDFTANAPNQKWAGDISYAWTQEGWLYLAVILDLHSHRVIGWAVSNRMKRDLAIRALEMAIALRTPPIGCIHHTDRGTQGGFNRSSQHPVDGGADDKNRQTKMRTFDPGQIKLTRNAASLAT
jgi:putative transposase